MVKEIYLIAALIIAGLATVTWLIINKLNQLKQASKLDENLIKVINNLQQVSPNLQKGLQSQSKNLSDSLQQSTRATQFISQVAKEVGQMNELSQSIRELQVFLQSPKLRGNIGEQVLKDLIKQSFPKGSFNLQYSFKSGEKVDAAITTSAGILPIDSKFPMENFKKMSLAEAKQDRLKAKRTFINDVKKHIRDIAKKYILPEEGTLDFAFMYLPSEAIFNEVSNAQELLEYARERRIYPVSPNTLYVHLQTVLLSFEGQKLEAKSRQVFRVLRAIQKDYQKTDSVLTLLGKHLTNAYNQFNNVWQNFSLLGQKLDSSQTLTDGVDESKKLKDGE